MRILSVQYQTITRILHKINWLIFSQQADLTGIMGFKNTVRRLSFESRRILMLVDGQRVFGGYHTGDMAGGGEVINVNVVPVSLVERIEVVKDPTSALYGSDEVSGIINIITKTPATKLQPTVGRGYGWYSVDDTCYGVTTKDKNRSTYNAYTTVAGSATDRLRHPEF